MSLASLKEWLRPTLTRRLVGGLLLAFALFAALVLVQDQLDIQQQMADAPGVRELGRQIASGLSEVDDAHQATLMVAGLARHSNEGRRQVALLPGELLFQLYDASGQRLYGSAEAAPIARAGVGEQQLLGRRHWTYRTDGPRWSVRIAEPAISSTDLLGFSSWELAKVLLWGFPLMLLPLWLAVHTGLAPLRRFARRLDGLDATHRLEPLGVDLRYGELRPLGRAFDALLARLRDRQAREQAFVHDAAHELRTPLAVVSAQAHVLVNAEDPQARAAASTALREAVARSAHLSQQLLDLAALDGGQARAPEVLDVAALAARLLAAQASLARERGIALSLDAPDHLRVCLDRLAFESVLQNLLDNSLRYVPPGCRIEVSLQADALGGLRLAVADNGPGIAAADHAQVFERFWRGVGHDQPGTGLGLAIVRQAARRLGGRVQLGAGLDGRGACFELQLPAEVILGNS
ncbi:MAG: HAMP domain-containing histidine kinase [Burkholderiales bacterium]|nr:HAMP domain-containing histidine kinase [Burkholderiales bacterium]